MTWQQSLSQSLISFEELCAFLKLDLKALSTTYAAIQSFPLRVPREFLSRMEKNNPNDPLLLQVLPQAIEMQNTIGFTKDPLQEQTQNPIPGLLHKYPNRVLLTLTGACAVHCRYCFRRHFPYENNLPSKINWQRALLYIANREQIDEVILSGGDPLVLKDNLLAEFITQLETIKHVKRVRLHTRLPIMIPARVTDELVSLLSQSRFQVIIVLHCNHANEIDEAVKNAVLKCRRALITVLNQSVLLKNINDNADALVNLSKRLFDMGVLPYYLHWLDKVEGSAHFDVPTEKADALMVEIKKQLPGFLVPKLAREIPGMLHKVY
ncbi:MAG TPA: EF-P beta-lysylation protein EpmB [Coxiellaceae bacterium]|nr:EF-P beta-lysylation protein EpmB [Coxiellaceae bacterium]